MSQYRPILEALSRDELLHIADSCDLHVADRRRRALLVEAIAEAPVDLGDVLPGFSRDRLKEICRELELDDSGREKTAIVERIVGAVGRPKDGFDSLVQDFHARLDAFMSGAPLPERSSLSEDESGGRAARHGVDTSGSEKLTTAKLEAHLWSAADILRGSIDSADYKNYIFGLLFLKRLSDRFEEETELLRNVPGAHPEDPDEHDFFVPEKARWGEIQKVATGVGEALNRAASLLEEHNAKLEGVLAGIDYNDERKLGDAKARDVVLGRLVIHFGKLDLRNASLSEPDMLGRAYEYLIEKFADDAGKKGGEFYTPRMVVRLIVELLQPKEGMRICDPTVGSGGMLIECAHHLERCGQNAKNLSLFGQEKNLGTWAICKMNMLLHGLSDARIEKGDTLRDPKLRDGRGLLRFDRVIANPPFSLDEWGRKEAEGDAYGRFGFGLPPKTKGDLAFVQHMIATTNDDGMVGVVMPHGVLFRGAAEGRIRQGMLEEDLVEAVVGLPTNLFYGTGIPAAVLVFNKNKPKARRGKVLFIEASREFREGTAQNFLREEDVRKIAAAYHAFEDVEKYAKVVTIEEIGKNDFNLNISRYVETAEAAERVDVGEALTKLRELEAKRAAAEERMNGFLRELGYEDA